jgi:hypothetical protein
VTLSIANPQPIAEGDAGTTNLAFTVNRSGDLSSDVQVGYATADGTAKAGTDYTAVAGTLTIPANQTQATINVPILGNTQVQPDRSFTLQLSGTSNGFAPQKSFPVGSAPRTMVTADFNGDGKPDIAVVNQGDNNIGVLLNTTPIGATTPSFASEQIFATASTPFRIAVADFNGDGKPDLAFVNYDASVMGVLLNTTPKGASSVSFASRQDFATNSYPEGITVGDFNGDGRPDIVVASQSAGAVSVYLNTTPAGAGSASFAPRQDFATGNQPGDPAVGDFNGDGKPDIAVPNWGGGNGSTVSLLLNTTPNGSGTPSFATQQTFATPSAPDVVAVGDFNGDGKPDLAITSSWNNVASVLLNTTPTGSGTFSFAAHKEFTVGDSTYWIVVADFNGDGRPDLATSNWNSNNVSVLVNTTPAGSTTPSFSPQQTFATDNSPDGLTVGDFNGDGKPDLASSNYLSSGTISVLLNTSLITIQGSPATGTIHDDDAPASVSALAGTTPQTVLLGAAFAPLTVVVKNAAGNPVQGASVTFTAPNSGASGLFSNGQTSITGSSDVNGKVTEALTANQTLGSYNVSAAASTGTTATFQLTNTSITLSTLAGASPQTAPLGTAFAPLIVVAKDAAGNPVSGISITLTAPGTGPGGAFSNGQATTTATTDANGQASASFKANQTAGSYTVTAVGGGSSTAFQLSNAPLFPSAPTLTGPGTTPQRRPTLTWNGIWGAVRFEFWLNNSQGNVLDPTNITVTSFVPPSDLTYDSYTAWVRAFDGAGNPSTWSSATSFRVFDPNVPVLSGPTGTITQTQPTLSWTAVASATSYELYLSNVTTGQNPYLNPTGITGTSFTPGAALVPGTYTAWIRAHTASGTLPWSDPLTFSEAAPAPPIVGRPGGGGEAMALKLSFSWVAAQDAASYELWVNDLTTGQTKAIYQNDLSGTSYTVAGTTALGTYEIWLRSYNAAGQAGAWSAGQVFTVRNLLTPALNTTGGEVPTQTPTFNWDPVAGATSYEVWVNDSNGQTVVDQPNVTGTSFTPTKPLPLGTYTAWVRAYATVAAPADTQGTRAASMPDQSQWSTPWNFALVQLTTPQITAPASPTTTTSPNLTWTASSDGVAADQGVIQYELWVNNLTTGQSKIIHQTMLTATSFTPTTPLPPGNYAAWVQASFGGKVSAWSSSYLFTIALPQPPLLGLSGLVSAPVISWNTVLGATQYELWIGTAANLVQVQDVQLLGTSLPTQGLLTKGNYSVWVRAINDAGQAGAWSEELDFTMPG